MADKRSETTVHHIRYCDIALKANVLSGVEEINFITLGVYHAIEAGGV